MVYKIINIYWKNIVINVEENYKDMEILFEMYLMFLLFIMLLILF